MLLSGFNVFYGVYLNLTESNLEKKTTSGPSLIVFHIIFEFGSINIYNFFILIITCLLFSTQMCNKTNAVFIQIRFKSEEIFS